MTKTKIILGQLYIFKRIVHSSLQLLFVPVQNFFTYRPYYIFKVSFTLTSN